MRGMKDARLGIVHSTKVYHTKVGEKYHIVKVCNLHKLCAMNA
jgi:hypothetical protein